MAPGFRGHELREPLSDYVVGLWSHGHYVQPHARERVLPTGTMTLAVSIDEDGVARAAIAGARSRCFLLDTSRPLSVIAASFRVGGGFGFFGVPAGELQNSSVPLELLPGGDAATLSERLLEARNGLARFRALEQFLLGRLKEHAGASPAIRYAVNAFQRSNPPPSVGSVAERIGWTARRFIARFRDEVGLTPKVYSRVVRFRKAVATLDGCDDVDWADVALSCGYGFRRRARDRSRPAGRRGRLVIPGTGAEAPRAIAGLSGDAQIRRAELARRSNRLR